MAEGALVLSYSYVSILVLLLTSSEGFCSVCEPDRHCSNSGSACIDSCSDLTNGYYQWCGRCDFYVQCLSGTQYYHPCEPNLLYDNNHERCGTVSETCSCSSTGTTTMTTPPVGACSSGPCFNGGTCKDTLEGGYTCTCAPGWTGITCGSLIPCSMLTTRSDPILIQQHIDGSSFFDKTWAEMLLEQGAATSDYWIGLTELSDLLIAGQGRFQLLIDLIDTSGVHHNASYSTFNIGTANNNFTLTVGGYRGDAGDALSTHNSMKFSTRDRDNDLSGTSNMAEVLGGAWWYYSTCRACLNSSPSEYYIWTYAISLHLQRNTMYIHCVD